MLQFLQGPARWGQTFIRSFWLAFVGGGLILSACSTAPRFVQLDGQFSSEAPAPEEIRVLLDPRVTLADDADLSEAVWQPVFPDEFGGFTTGPIDVPGGGRMPVPTFYLSFSNEKDVVYVVGPDQYTVRYEVFNATGEERLSREEVCWLILRARPASVEGGISLSLAIAPNFDVRKHCLPPGTYTPGRLNADEITG